MQMPWEISDKRAAAPVADFDARKITDHAIARYVERVREVAPGTHKQEILRCLAAAPSRHLRALKRRRKKRTLMVPTGCCVFVFGRGGIMVTVLTREQISCSSKGNETQ